MVDLWHISIWGLLLLNLDHPVIFCSILIFQLQVRIYVQNGAFKCQIYFLNIELMDLRGMRQKLCREVGEKKVEAWETAGLFKLTCWKKSYICRKTMLCTKSGLLNHLNTVQSLATEGLMCWAVKLSKSPCEKLFPYKVRNRHGIIYSSVEGALIYLQPQIE